MLLQTPAPRAFAAGARHKRAAGDAGALLMAIACVVAALMLYALCLTVLGPGDDEELLGAGAPPSHRQPLVLVVRA
jgi:hypothetical protein